MNYTNEKSLHNCYSRLYAKILEQQMGTNDTTFSFHHGIPKDQEGYKYSVWEKAHKIICTIPWEEPGLVGNGIIKQKVLDALRVAPDSWGNTQNLVEWDDIILFDDIQQVAALEEGLFNLYTTDNDETSFKALRTVIGNKFALISYLFFIKDREQYCVVRPDNFAWRFKMLGVKEACTFPCTWGNYVIFMDVLREIQEFLNARIAEVSLLDAHSFVWMFWMIKDDASKPVSEILDVPENESYVMKCGTEGRVIEYYTKRYERDPSLRAEAIHLHGLRCAVCGFSFEEAYGAIGKGFIEVHHCRPLYSVEEEIVVNPATDLVCLCANCHRMIHRKKNQVFSIEELRDAISKQNS